MQAGRWSVLALGPALMVGCMLEGATDVPATTAGGGGESNVAGKIGSLGNSNLANGVTGGASAGGSSAAGTANGGDSSVTPLFAGAGGEGGAQTVVPTPTPQAGAGGEGGEAGAGGAGGSSGGNACTADTDSDGDNCGACGHSCLGGECKAGHCAPVVLAKDQLQMQGLTADNQYVYWVTSSQNLTGKVQKVAFGGGAITTLATNQSNPGSLVLDQGNLFWSNVYCCSSTIMKVSADGGTATPIATAQPGPQGLTYYDGAVYWPNHVAAGSLMSASTSGGAATTVIANVDRPTSIALDATNIYWTEDGAGVIRKAPRAGGAAALLVSNQKNPTLVNVSATYLYWINDTSMMRQALSGGSAEPFQVADGRATIMVDSKNIYWGNDNGIKLAAHGSNVVQTLVEAKDVSSVGNMWFDAKSVYWTDWKGGRVLRRAR